MSISKDLKDKDNTKLESRVRFPRGFILRLCHYIKNKNYKLKYKWNYKILSTQLLLDSWLKFHHPILQAGSWFEISSTCCLPFNFHTLFSKRVPNLLFHQLVPMLLNFYTLFSRRAPDLLFHQLVAMLSISSPFSAGGLLTCYFINLFLYFQFFYPVL